MRFVVEEAEAGKRLDAAVASHFGAGCSTRTAARLIGDGAVRMNGRPGRKGTRVAAGDEIEVDEAAAEAGAAEFDPVPLARPDVSVLHRDDRVIVLDKPAGLDTAPIRKGDVDTLVSAALAIVPSIGSVRGFRDREPGLLHRLDRDTSGACLFALDQAAFSSLVASTRADRIAKEYLAIVAGRIEGGPLVLEATVERRGGRGRKVAISSLRVTRGSDLAPSRGEGASRILRTRIEVVDRTARHTLAAATITRGFRHQVRACLAAAGHPVAGDAAYGGGDGGLMLHATFITFPHPTDGKACRVGSDPARIEDAWAEQGF